MSDYPVTNSNNDELDAILNEVKSGNFTADPVDEAPSKEWTMADIDRLIAGTEGEEYIPEVDSTPAGDDISGLFSGEFDADMFTVRPIEAEKEEIEDISSGVEEVEGQELLYSQEDDFDADSFELEAIEITDDEPSDIFSSSYQQEMVEQSKEEEAVIAPEPEKTEEEKIVDYRERFFKKLTLEDIGYVPEEEPEQEGPVDLSGTVLFKNEENKTEADLEPMPTIKAAEDVINEDDEKTKIIKEGTKIESNLPEKIDNDVEGQMVLTGFTEMPEEAVPEQSPEEEIEENLWKKRKQKAMDFKIEGLDEEEFGEEFEAISSEADGYVPEEKKEETVQEASLIEAIGEYNEPTDRNRIHSKLAARLKKTMSGVIVVGIIEAVVLLLAVLPPIANALSIETSLFVSDSRILCIINAVLIIAAVAFDSDRFFDSVTGIFKGRFTGDTACTIAVAVALIENTLSAITDAKTPVFGAVAIAGILINKLTDAIDARRVFYNFQVCAFNYEHNMYAVHAFENENEVFELGRGLLMGNAEMLYSSKVDFPSNFIRNSDENGEDNKKLRLMLIISAAVSLAVGIATGIKQQSLMAGIGAFAASICLSMPIFGKFIPAFITFIHNRKLNHEGTMVVSLDAAEKTAAANAVVLDSADIFDRGNCTMHGMNYFQSMRVDVVLRYAAAMVIKSGGPLKECFEKVVDGRLDILPPVRELVYEDKMGISARIYEQKVLLGNRNMLIHHNIEAPDKASEDRYQRNGRKVIYLAVNEKLAALFVVSYSVDEEMKNYLKQLEKNGIQTLVRTNDVNVTEELISERFGINTNNFKILSSVAGRLYKRRKDTVSDTLDAGVIHDGDPRSMLKAIASCCTMANRKKIGTLLQFVLMATGAALTLLASFGENGLTSTAALGILAAEIGIAVVTLFPFNLIKKEPKE